MKFFFVDICSSKSTSIQVSYFLFLDDLIQKKTFPNDIQRLHNKKI